jgi:GNAT superfamily N-acetyltransferase
MSLRTARPDDVAAIVDVTNRAYLVEQFFITGTRTTAGEVSALMSQPGSRFLVVEAVEPACLDGSVYMELRGERGYFAMFAVDPARQGSGLARRLIEAVEAECRAAGCRWLDIEVVDLRTELPPFYAKFGFRAFATAPFKDRHKLRREAHTILMTKPLA